MWGKYAFDYLQKKQKKTQHKQLWIVSSNSSTFPISEILGLFVFFFNVIARLVTGIKSKRLKHFIFLIFK